MEDDEGGEEKKSENVLYYREKPRKCFRFGWKTFHLLHA